MSEFDFIFDENRNFQTASKIDASITTVKSTKRSEKLIKRFSELDKFLPKKISKDECVHLISSDAFGSIELLNCINKRHKIEELLITTWSYNLNFVQTIESLLESGSSIFFCVDKSMKKKEVSVIRTNDIINR